MANRLVFHLSSLSHWSFARLHRSFAELLLGLRKLNVDLARNPFFVLELDPQCSRIEVEREGQKLLAMLEVGFAEATTYPTPLGERPRTAEDVREAMATLRDPDKRLLAELWANVPNTPDSERAMQDEEIPTSGPTTDVAPGNAFPSAMKALRLL